jgi:uncharacterized protein (TIGR02466 family)
VSVPPSADVIKFEDPRLGLMMAAPPRKAGARRENRTFITVAPKPGTVLLWESWLRHEVPVNRSRKDRISLSFNYGWRYHKRPATAWRAFSLDIAMRWTPRLV